MPAPEPPVVIIDSREQVEIIESVSRIEIAHHRPQKPLRAMSVPKDLFIAALERYIEQRQA